MRLIRDRGVSYAQASQDLKVHPTPLRNWVKAFADDPQHTFPGQGQMKPEQLEIARLKRQVIKLKEVCVAGKRNFWARDKRPEKAPELKAWRSGDKTYLQNLADSGLIAGFGEISVRTRMRGGESGIRTMNLAGRIHLKNRLNSASCAPETL